MTNKIHEDKPSGRFENDHNMLIINIIHTADWLEHKILKVLTKYELTHVQFNILRNLETSRSRVLSINEIKSGILFSKSDVSRIIDRLVRKGLITRDLCKENRRKMDIQINKAGLDLLKIIKPEIKRELDNFYANKITDKEAKVASKVLEKIRQ